MQAFIGYKTVYSEKLRKPLIDELESSALLDHCAACRDVH